MSGVRRDRFFASTVISVLLLAISGAALADPLTGRDDDSATPVPDAAIVAPPAASSEQPTAKPADPTDEATTPAAAEIPAEPSKPDQSSGQSAGPADPAAAAGTMPGSTPNPDPSTAEPVLPTAAEHPAAKPEPGAAATGKDSSPANSAATPPAAPAGAPTPTPTVVVDVNAAIAEQLHNLANGKFDRLIGGKKERAAIEAYYSGRTYAPLWITDGKANARAKAAIAYLRQVDVDGLEPADYPVPDFASLSDPAALAEAEIRLTVSVVTYAHHAQIGRVHWSRVSGDIFYDHKAPEPADVLTKVLEAKDAGAALAAYEPHSAGYLALKAKLAEIRAGKSVAGKTQIAQGPAPKVGMQDERVPQLRERLGVAGDGGNTYDKALADAVKKFQHEHELKPTGMLTPATIEALNGRRPDRPTDIIIANMERWRWMPHELGKTYVMVNLPDYTLRVIHNGKLVWMTKVVDGKPTTPTPIMSAEMKYITVNPTWNVPPSIANNEYLPLLQQDPTILERMGLRVSRNPDGTLHISQPPGDNNALGRLRFNFPNKFLVYQHDSNEKYLFANEKRARSHGCMRVQDPVKYAEVLLSLVRPGDGYTQDRIRRMFGNNEEDIPFPTFIPVHLTYQTAFVDDGGKLEFREDVYGRDKALLAVLKGAERKVADIPIERKDNVARRQALALPDQPLFWGGRTFGGGYSDGPNFFERLFGGPFGAPPVPRRPVAQRRTDNR